MQLCCLVFLIVLTGFLNAQGFLKADNKKIVDGDGNEIILRGMGLGGWMLQEGYMMKTSSFANPQHEIKAKIQDLIGEADMHAFYDAWLNNHCRKIDIDSLAAWGFNSVRLPMHYNLFTLPIEKEPIPGGNTWLQTGFDLTDSLLSWCGANQMYLILDLHAAPGGQGRDAAISDYDQNKPSLWESAANRQKTVALWRRLAERYANEPWIGGYDLINETNWDLPGNNLLKSLYLDITNAIREVDNNHIIFIEGNWWANDFTGLTPPWDNNMVYSFHKYWSHNDQGAIQWMLNIRHNFNVPIWCGESGENSNVWFRDAIRLFEDNDIGWAWWPLKKVSDIRNPLEIKMTAVYQTLLDYWSGNGPRPSQTFARDALMELAENAKLENCNYRHGVIDAMFRQVQSNDTKPFKRHQVPGKVAAAEYDLGRNGFAYYDTDIADYHVSTGNWTGWNNGWAFRNDGVDIGESQNTEESPYNIGWIENNEWITYTVNASVAGIYTLDLLVASESNTGKIEISIGNKPKLDALSIPQTGGWQTWQWIESKEFELKAGPNTIKLFFKNGSFNLNTLKFNLVESLGWNSFDNDNFWSANYPNPFIEKNSINMVLNEDSKVIVSVYDSLGRKVTTLVDERLSDGEKNLEWNGRDHLGNLVSSGVYFYEVQIGNKVKYQKTVKLN